MKTMIAIAVYACFTAANGQTYCEEQHLPRTVGSCFSYHAQAHIARWLNENPGLEMALASDGSMYRCRTEPFDDVLGAVQEIDPGRARIVEAPGMPEGWGIKKPELRTAVAP